MFVLCRFVCFCILTSIVINSLLLNVFRPACYTKPIINTISAPASRADFDYTGAYYPVHQDTAVRRTCVCLNTNQAEAAPAPMVQHLSRRASLGHACQPPAALNRRRAANGSGVTVYTAVCSLALAKFPDRRRRCCTCAAGWWSTAPAARRGRSTSRAPPPSWPTWRWRSRRCACWRVLHINNILRIVYCALGVWHLQCAAARPPWPTWRWRSPRRVCHMYILCIYV